MFFLKNMEIISEEFEYESSNKPREINFSETNWKGVNRIKGFTNKTLNLTLDTFRRSLKGRRKTLRKQIPKDTIRGKGHTSQELISVVNLELDRIKPETFQEVNINKIEKDNNAPKIRTEQRLSKSFERKGYGSALDFVVTLMKKRVKMRRYYEDDDEAVQGRNLKR